MHLIIITKPDFFDGETDICNNLFANSSMLNSQQTLFNPLSSREGRGGSFIGLHLRKPEATREQLAKWIEEIEPLYRRRIVLHDHYDLALEYGLGGIHISPLRRPREGSWERAAKTGGSCSRSCHSIEEVEACQKDYDYVFLSPIFDSISKQGYRAAFTKEELAEAKRKGILYNVYALGGITFENLPEVERLGFAGAAMLGGFWNKENEESGNEE